MKQDDMPPNATTTIEQRMAAARQLLHSGRYQLALNRYRQLAEERPGQPLVLANIAACYYMLEYFVFWQEAVNSLEGALQGSHPHSESDEVQLHAWIALAQNLEELGFVVRASEIYQGVLDQAKTQACPELLAHVLSQLVRVQSVFLQPNQFTELCYLRLSALAAGSCPDRNIDAGIQHALIGAELRQVGSTLGFQRLAGVLTQNRFLNPQDQALILVDFLEASLLNGYPLPEAILDMARTLDLKALGAFGGRVRDLCLMQSLSPADFQSSQDKPMSPAARIRWIALASKRVQSGSFRLELLKLLALHLRSLPEREQTAWLRAYTVTMPGDVFYLHENEFGLVHNGQLWPLKKRKIVFQLVKLLVGRESAPLAEVCREIWNLPLEESSYNRLRINVLRCNREFHEFFGKPALFSINGDQLKAKVLLFPRS